MHWGCLALCLAAAGAAAQTVTPEEEYAKRIRASQTVEPLKDDVFGDKINFYNGATEFSVVDVSLPGNSELPVEVRRQLPIEDWRTFQGALKSFGDWSLDVPYIDGVFATSQGWKVISANGYDRCSARAIPDTSTDGSSPGQYSDQVWDGYALNLPGRGRQELLINDQPALPGPASGGPYYWTTSDHHRIACLPSVENLAGEGFLVLAPDGTRYTMNYAITKAAGAVTDISRVDTKYHGGSTFHATIPRSRIYMMATKVEDRFGNTVNYHYVGDELRQITASDGRAITLDWLEGKITSVTSAAGTWSYGYRNEAIANYHAEQALAHVHRPDGSRWSYSLSGELRPGTVFREDGPRPTSMCQYDLDRAPGSDFYYTIGAPSGASATYRFYYTRHWRTHIPTTCQESFGGPRYPDVFGVFYQWSLQSKQVTGPGLEAQTWTYGYETVEPTMYYRAPWPEPIWSSTTTYIPGGTCATCPVSKTTTVVGPTHTTLYEFGAQYGRNEGRLLSTTTASPDGTQVLHTVSHEYLPDAEIGTQPFPDNVGRSLLPIWENPMTARTRPLRRTTTTQDGVDAARLVNAFDVFARPLTETKSNALFSRTDMTEYHDDLALWVLGQTRRTTTDGIETARTVFDAKALPAEIYEFGDRKQSLTYHVDGTLATLKDGNNHVTTLVDWKRGIPRTIRFPATPEAPSGSTRTAAVNDAGWIDRVTDENGYSTAYGYDLMGRISRVTQPVGDDIPWNDTTQDFRRVDSAEYGIPAGHWRQTIATGDGRKETYYDALWRPVVVREYDIGNVSGTQRFNVFAYDAAGRPTFASYPLASLGAVGEATRGTRTAYDALGRTVRVEQDSELGVPLVTETEYPAGGKTRMTNPRREQTTTSYLFYDQPGYDWPLRIEHPEGVVTEITRDVFGAPTSVTRSDADG